MKLQQIFEARRNPEMSPRIDTFERLREFHGMENIFVTMTSVLKVGINPNALDATPFGIYSYPLEYVLMRGRGLNRYRFLDLPYRDNAEYLTIFQQQGEILDLERYSEGEFNADVNMLLKDQIFIPILRENKQRNKANAMKLLFGAISEVSEGIQVTIDDFTSFEAGADGESEEEDLASFMIEQFREMANVPTPGGRLWAVLYFGSNVFGNLLRRDPRALWTNWMFSVLDYDAVADYTNRGIIHENEPTQAVHFSTRTIKVMETIENNKSKLYRESQERLIYDGDGITIKKVVRGKDDLLYTICGGDNGFFELRGLETHHVYDVAKSFDDLLSVNDLQFLYEYSGMELDQLEEFDGELLEEILTLAPVSVGGVTSSHAGNSWRFEKIFTKFFKFNEFANIFFTLKLAPREYQMAIDNIADAFEDKGFEYVGEMVKNHLGHTEHSPESVTFGVLRKRFYACVLGIRTWIEDEANAGR